MTVAAKPSAFLFYNHHARHIKLNKRRAVTAAGFWIYTLHDLTSLCAHCLQPLPPPNGCIPELECVFPYLKDNVSYHSMWPSRSLNLMRFCIFFHLFWSLPCIALSHIKMIMIASSVLDISYCLSQLLTPFY